MLWLSRIFKPFLVLLTGLDRLLVYLATPLGARIAEPRKRYAILLITYTAIYAVAALPIPVLPLVALAIGYIGVLAVGRAWVWNEKERILIAKRLKDGDPDQMPDLRWTALVSALQLVILFPLIFQQVQWHFGWYTVHEGATFWTWVAFTLDSYNKAVLGLLQVYGIHLEEVGYESTWGRHLVTLSRLTFDYLLIQGAFRILAIRETIRDTVAAVKRPEAHMPKNPKSDMVVRIGKRAVTPLIASIHDPDKWVRAAVVRALGELKDPRAVEPLMTALKDTETAVRQRAATGLGSLNDCRAVQPLVNALQDPEASVRGNAVASLGELKDLRAVEPLITALNDTETAVRGNAAEALGRLNDRRAVQPLVNALQDPVEYVRGNAAKSLMQLDPVAGAKAGVK